MAYKHIEDSAASKCGQQGFLLNVAGTTDRSIIEGDGTGSISRR